MSFEEMVTPMKTNGWIAIGALMVSVACVACGDDTVATTTASGGAAPMGGMGGVGASGGGGGAPMGGMGGGGMGGMTSTGGMTSAGGGPTLHPGVLVDDGLIARYYIDEATMGQTPTELVDAAADPLNLPITYVPELNFEEKAPGQTGLTWDDSGIDGVPYAPLNGTKFIGALQTSTTATIEMVVEVLSTTSSNSRLLFIGQASNSGRLTFSSRQPTLVEVYSNEERQAAGFVDFLALGRVVLHAVYDSSQVVPEDRVRMYLNGGRLPSFDTSPVPQDEVIDLMADRDLAIGNRANGDRSIAGTIYYAAIYSTALSDAQVVQNALWLAERDDTPVMP